jgi:PAS domain S-box-containing protein
MHIAIKERCLKGKMKTKMEQFLATNPNPVLSVGKDGTVLYSNEAGEPLLHEWRVKIGEKLPSSIGDLVQRVISSNSPEKLDVKAGSKVYLVVFHPLPEQECVNISGFDISDQKELEGKLREAHEKIHKQSEELQISNEESKFQSDELNEANALLHDSIIGFRTLAENSPDLIARFDRQGICSYANPAAKFYDIPIITEFNVCFVNDCIVKTNPKLRINPVFTKSSEKQRKNVFITGKPETMEFLYTSSQGKKFYFETKIVPEFVNNEVVSVLVISHDITVIKKTEANLKSSNLYNRSLIEASPDPLVIIGNDGKVTDVNKATEQATGYSRNDLIGTYFAQYLTEPDHAISAFINVCTHGELRDCALEIKHKDGHITPVLCNASVYKDENGKVIGVFVAARDITKLKKAEKALKKAHDSLEEKVKERTAELEEAYSLLRVKEASLSEAQEMAHIGNWERNFANNKLHWSDETYRIFGLKPQEIEVTYNLFLNYVHPDDRDYVENTIKRAVSENSFDINFRIIRDHGEERIVHDVGKVIFDEKYNPVWIKGTMQDITERKESEDTLAKIEIVRKKEIHHRIKNNLQVISSMLDLQADTFRDKEEIKDSEIIEAFRESQSRVISMALIHEELYKGGGCDTLNFLPYIHKLTNNLFLTYRLGNSDVSLNTDLDENLFFDMDTAIPLGIIVNEIVSNSLKHAFKGRDKGEIRIKLSREENEDCKSTCFVLNISDDGIGIPEDLEIEDLDSLGMQLITILVDQLDGELELKRNNGTEFTIRFTVTEKNNQASEPAP